MADRVKSISRMILRGVGGISLYRKHNYGSNIPVRGQNITVCWEQLGLRLRGSADKVMRQYGRS